MQTGSTGRAGSVGSPHGGQTIRRERLHRAIFLCAAVYNVVWGLVTALDPQWLFRMADMPPMRHPAVFACVGMIVGLYGAVYAEVARRPERGFVLAAVGLAGKVLGPIGWLDLHLRGEWPASSLLVILTNDLIWWLPFGLYLRDAWPGFRADLASGWPFARHAPASRMARPPGA